MDLRPSSIAEESDEVLRYLTIPKFSAESGYTEDAVRAKMKAGVWLEGVVWVKAPDGRILISVEGYETWVEGNMLAAVLGSAPRARRASSSTSTIAVFGAARG
jgi:hypothetical protein